MMYQDQAMNFVSLLGLQLSASVPVLLALAAALLARGWLSALILGVIGYAISAVLQPAMLALVTQTPELALFGLVGLQRAGFTLQLLATATQFVVITLLIYWAVRRRRVSTA
jgi:hypothetical protein